MKLIYTTQTSGFEDGLAYRNPQYFERTEAGAERVTVVGDWPAVVAAYEATGAEVKTIKPKTPEKNAEVSTAIKPLTVPQIKAALAEKGIEIPEGITKRDGLLGLLGTAAGQGEGAE